MLQSGNFNFVNSIKPAYLHYHVVPNGDVVWGIICKRLRATNGNNRSALTCTNRSRFSKYDVIKDEHLKYLSDDQVLDMNSYDLLRKLTDDGVIE